MALKVAGTDVVNDSREIVNVITYNGYVPANQGVNITGGDGLTGGGSLSASRTLSVDATVIRTTGDQTLGGTKTFSANVIVNGGISAPSLMLLSAGGGQHVAVSSGVSGSLYVQFSTNAITANRTLIFPDANVTLVGGTMVPNTVVLTAGDGLTGGGSLAANRSFAVDDTVVRTSGNQTIAGIKTFSSLPTMSAAATPTTDFQFTTKGYVDTYAVSIAGADIITGAKTFRQPLVTGATVASEIIIQSNGGHMFLDAGGTAGHVYVKSKAGDFRLGFVTSALTANRALTFPDANVILVSGTMVPNTVQVIAGNGLTGGGTLAANRTLAVGAGDGISVAATSVGVDATVVRTTGNQTIAGIKSFSSTLESTNVAGTSWGNTAIAGGTAIKTIGATTTASWAITVTNSADAFVGGLQFHNGNATARLYTSDTNFIEFNNSIIQDTAISTNIARSAIQVIAGNGLTGGGTLAANRTLAVGAGDGIAVAATTVGVDSTVIRTTGNQIIAGTKTFSTIPVTSVVPTAPAHIANKLYVDNAIVAYDEADRYGVSVNGSVNRYIVGTRASEYDAPVLSTISIQGMLVETSVFMGQIMSSGSFTLYYECARNVSTLDAYVEVYHSRNGTLLSKNSGSSPGGYVAFTVPFTGVQIGDFFEITLRSNRNGSAGQNINIRNIAFRATASSSIKFEKTMTDTSGLNTGIGMTTDVTPRPPRS